MTFDINSLLTLFLVYLRVVTFLIMVPFFGKEFMPNTFKVYLAGAVALAIYLYADIQPAEFPTTGHFFMSALKEFLFAFVAGFMLRLVFDSMQIAGELISLNMGLSLATVFNPQQPQTTVMAFIYSLIASLLFISVGGAEVVLLALSSSFQKVPPGGFSLYDLNPEVFLQFFYESFLLAFKIALPIVVVMLLFNLVLALTNRFIPQINVFMVGLPIQVLIGFFVLFLSMPVTIFAFSTYLREYIIKFVTILGS